VHRGRAVGGGPDLSRATRNPFGFQSALDRECSGGEIESLVSCHHPWLRKWRRSPDRQGQVDSRTRVS